MSLIPIVAAVVLLAPLALVAAAVAALAAHGRRHRPENTPGATLLAARRHEDVTSVIGFLGGFAVFVAVVVLGLGPRLPGPPGITLAVAPAASALVHLAVHAVGERTWPRPVGAVRSAALRRRSVRDLTGRRLVLLIVTVAVLGVALLVFSLTADQSGRAVAHLITSEDARAGSGGGASGPYPGAPYAVPVAVGTLMVLLAGAWVLHLAARRPAVSGTRVVDDLVLRRTSARRILGGTQLAVGATATGVLLVAGGALSNAGWALGAWVTVGLAAACGLVSMGAAASAVPSAPAAEPTGR
ncbi:hypothetical protein GCM10023169_07240 [Georgenia halophila]|uniref:DUF1648 domain-containing protein n=1 Tax=Georgenia halophila TaxID=620889 RepID=A0ABP8KWG2_9MICO